MTDEQLLRYSRHILLDEIGIDGQRRIVGSHVLIVGLGGLGSPAALYLASAGVGTLTLVDGDTVDLTNLQRQIAHGQSSVGLPNAVSAAHAVSAINPEVKVHPIVARATPADLQALIATADVVLDCTDNFAARHAINAACVSQRKPLVSGAAIRFDGQISVFDPRNPASPCYACLFPPDVTVAPDNCATLGVFAPLVGIVGATQAAEALKLICSVGASETSLSGRLLMLDALRMSWSEILIPRQPDCPVCGQRRS